MISPVVSTASKGHFYGVNCSHRQYLSYYSVRASLHLRSKRYKRSFNARASGCVSDLINQFYDGGIGSWPQQQKSQHGFFRGAKKMD